MKMNKNQSYSFSQNERYSSDIKSVPHLQKQRRGSLNPEVLLRSLKFPWNNNGRSRHRTYVGSDALIEKLVVFLKRGSDVNNKEETINQKQLIFLQKEEEEQRKRQETMETLNGLRNFDQSKHSNLLLGNFNILHEKFSPSFSFIKHLDPKTIPTEGCQENPFFLTTRKSKSRRKYSPEEEELDFSVGELTKNVRKLVFQIKTECDRELHRDFLKVEKDIQEENRLSKKSKDDLINDDLSDINENFPFHEDSDYGSDDNGHNLNVDDYDEDLAASVRYLVTKLSHDADKYNNERNRQRKNSIFSGQRGKSISIPADSKENTKSSEKSGIRVILPGIKKFLRLKEKTYLFADQELEGIEGARWKMIELAYRFGGKHRNYLCQALNIFFPLKKYGRLGDPHTTRLHCNRCCTLQWQRKRGGWSDPIDLVHVLEIIEGRHTNVFRKHTSNEIIESCSLSLVFEKRTLDLETHSADHRDWLVSALRTLISYARRQRHAETRVVSQEGSKHVVEEKKLVVQEKNNGEDNNKPTSSPRPSNLEIICQKNLGLPVAA